MDKGGAITGRGRDFSLPHHVIPPLEYTQWKHGIISPRIKRPKCEPDHAPPSNDKV
jgi:hypothetical protein